MKYFNLEIYKCKRTGILAISPIVGILGAGYAFLNFFLRSKTLLALPLNPMDILLTQLYGMIMILNLISIIVATTMIFNIEFQSSAIKKLYMLPYKIEKSFLTKFIILTTMLLICFSLQNLSLGVIGKTYLPDGSFDLLKIVEYGMYTFATTLPVLSFMLFISSKCENIWITLGIGIIGFFSGMTLAMSGSNIFLINPFVIMMKPALSSYANINSLVLIFGIVETAIFLLLGLFFSKSKYYE